MKLEFSRQILIQFRNWKFHRSSFSRSQFVPCWGTDRGANRRRDMTKLINTFVILWTFSKRQKKFIIIKGNIPLQY